MFILISIILGVFVCFGLMMLGIGTYITIQNLRSPIILRKAQVIEKREHIAVSSTGFSISHFPLFFVTFRFLDGMRQELSINSSEYKWFEKGMCGTLRSKGNWYIGFDIEKQEK